jgi:hypothetical protein
VADAETRQQPKTYKPREVRLFKSPSAGFDPLVASDRELQIYGFPARPDVESYPELNEYWKLMMSPPISISQPRFGVMPDLRPAGPQAALASTSGDGWCGSAVQAHGDPFTFVAGQWTVPNIIIPPGANVPSWPILEGGAICGCSEWVGIDGWNGQSPAIVQAGTTQVWVASPGLFSVDLSLETWAWFEWYPHGPAPITNFRVSPGDVMSCVICVHTSTEVGVYMKNWTTGQYKPYIHRMPPDAAPLVGNTAEWVLENPVNGGLGVLPEYATVYFDYCLAGSQHRFILGGSNNAIPLQMNDTNGTTISRPEFITDRLITTTYVPRP